MGTHPVRRQRAHHRAPRGAAARPLPDDRLAVPRAQHLGADAVRHAARAARQGAARGSWLLGPNPNPNPKPNPSPNPSPNPTQAADLLHLELLRKIEEARHPNPTLTLTLTLIYCARSRRRDTLIQP